MHAIVICFDRLPYGLLGCYGNTTVRTPGFDRLAAQSVAFDNAFAVDLRQEGVDAMARAVDSLSQQGIPVHLFASGETALVRRLRAESPKLNIEPFELTRSETSNMDTMRRVVGYTDEVGIQHQRMTLVSLAGLADDDDGRRDDSVWAAISTADDVVGQLVDALAGREFDRPLVIVTAARGRSFVENSGENVYGWLREQMIHVPLLIQPVRPPVFGVRCGSLVTTEDVAATLVEWCGGSAAWTDGQSLTPELEDRRAISRDAIVVRGPDRTYGLRTAQWHLMTRIAVGAAADDVVQAAESAVLYMKPDDLWDQMNVAQQAPRVVETLVRRLIEGQAAIREIP